MCRRLHKNRPMTTYDPHQQINWRSRIVKTGKIRASQITPHPDNPRRHPIRQREVVAASFDKLGQIAPIIINVNNGYLVDGEERSWLALAQKGDVELDVTYVDITEEEHLEALAILDASGDLAEYDPERLERVLQAIDSASPSIQQMLADVAADVGLIPPNFQPIGIDEQPRLDEKKPVICPECGHHFVPND